MPWTVFGSTFPLFTSQVLKLCRRLCRPKRCPFTSTTPALTAAGRRWSRTKIDAQMGTLPSLTSDGKTKSSTFEYGLCARHSFRYCASTGCIGT